MLMQASITSSIRTNAADKTLYPVELQLRFQQLQVVHDGDADTIEDLDLGIVKLSRPRVYDTIRADNVAAGALQRHFCVAAHVRPTTHVRPGPEMRVCSEVFDDIAGFVGAYVRRLYGAVVGCEYLDGLRADAKGKFEGAHAQTQAIFGTDGVVE